MIPTICIELNYRRLLVVAKLKILDESDCNFGSSTHNHLKALFMPTTLLKNDIGWCKVLCYTVKGFFYHQNNEMSFVKKTLDVIEKIRKSKSIRISLIF